VVPQAVAPPRGTQVWDVVRVDFLYADSAAGGVRPGLAIATPAATDTFGIVWILMITSARHARWPDDVAVDDLAAAGLSHASVIRTGKIAAIDARLLATIGRLAKPNRAAVTERLIRHLGLALAV
jgi:mRNA interferase MazF